MRWIICCFAAWSTLAKAEQTIFFDDFERNRLDPAFWVAQPHEETGIVTVTNGVNDKPVGHSGRYAAMMAGSTNGTYLNYLDLHLDLSGFRDVALDFWIWDYTDETNLNDGLWFSDDGENFTKALDFNPSDWPNQYGRFPPIDIDELARQAGIRLTSRFVIRWAQQGNYSISNRHGFFIDDVRVYEPEKTFASLPFHDNFERGTLASHWTWAWPDDPRVNPASLISVEEGDMEGFYRLAFGNRYNTSGNLNALDLNLNLEGQRDVQLSFMLRGGYQPGAREDGIWLSDDGGENFIRVYDFWKGLWPDPNGNIQPIELGELARSRGLQLTSQFIVRFQYFDDGSFSDYYWRGFSFDDVKVFERPVTYVTPPFEDGFETNQLNSAWAHRDPQKTAEHRTARNSGIVERFSDIREVLVAHSGLHGLVLGQTTGEDPATVAVDLHLALAEFQQVDLRFFLMPFNNNNFLNEGFWLSNDGGKTFILGKRLDIETYDRFEWNEVVLDIDALARDRGLPFTDQFIVRLQAIDDGSLASYYMEGLVIDDVSVTGTRIPDTKQFQGAVPWVVDNAAFSTDLAIYNEGFSTARVTLKGVDRDGDEREAQVTIPGKSLYAISSGELFPGLTGYSLTIASNVTSLHTSFLTFNTEPQSGGRSPSQTTALPADNLTSRLLFGYVPGDETSALVLAAPQVNAGFTPVNLTLYDNSGTAVETTTVNLTGGRPLATLLSELFTQIPMDAAVEAVAENGTLLTGTTFVFNDQRQPSMAAAIPLLP